MADFPNRADLFSVGRRAILATPNTRINPSIVDVLGSDVNLLLGAASLMGEEDIAALIVALQGLFVDTAQGPALDRVVFDRYGLTRFPAVPATVDLTIARPVGPDPAGVYPAGSRVQTPGGIQYATDVDAVFGLGDTVSSPDPVPATALLTGPGGNTSAETITQFIDGPFDSTMLLTNLRGAAGGADAETDIQFRGRARGFFPTLRRATLGALEFAARQVPGVAVAKAIEILNPDITIIPQFDRVLNPISQPVGPLPACAVQLIVADASGGFSGAMLQAVRNALLGYRAAGLPVIVTGGVIEYVTVKWALSYDAGIDTVQAQSQVRAVTVSVAQFLRPGDVLYKSTLITAARTVPGVIVSEGSLIAPAGDLVPTATFNLLRVQPQDVLFT